MRELVRMQKLDHIRVQVSQKERLSSVGNSFFNQTVDINHGSGILNMLDNDSVTQDSLFVSRDQRGSASTTNPALRASIS